MTHEDSDAAAARGSDFVLVEGMRNTRGALERWGAAPGPVLSGWFTGAFLIAIGLLLGTWVASLVLRPDPTIAYLPGVVGDVDAMDLLRILGANSLVLALHATACVAGFIARSSLPLAAEDMKGIRRVVHEKAGPIAIWWVVAVTTFSLLTQSLALGFDAATLGNVLEIQTWLLIVTVLPHALLELTAVFLPLAAWLIASRREEWHDLLAATFVTVALAVPMLVVSGLIELYVWPELLEMASPRA